jgi:hypothetical protein
MTGDFVNAVDLVLKVSKQKQKTNMIISKFVQRGPFAFVV